MKLENETKVSHVQVRDYIEDLQSPNPRQRSHAAHELGDFQDPAAVPALITALKEDVNTYVRSAAAESLGHIGAAEAIFPLMDALHDPSSFVRRAAAIALGQMQAKEAQGALLQSLEDPNFYVRRAAINAIGKLGIPGLGPVLIPLLDTQDSRIQRTVITALRRLRTREAIPKMVALLESYITSPTPRDLPVVKSLVIALGELRAREAVPVLVRVVRGYVGARSLSVIALGQIGDAQAGPVLVEALQDKSTNLQLAVLKSLGRLRYTRAAPSVRHFLVVPDPRMRRAAALTCGQLGDMESIATLLNMAQSDSSPLVRPAAVAALGEIGDANLAMELLPLVEDTNAYLRASLADTLRLLYDGSSDVRKALQCLANDKVEHVAAAGTEALQNLENGKDGGLPLEQEEASRKGLSWIRRLFRRG